MATSIAIEEESGTGSGRCREHNGYYAGDFWTGTRRIRPTAQGVVVGWSPPPTQRSGLGGQPSPLVR
jgi:hypothetical protein